MKTSTKRKAINKKEVPPSVKTKIATRKETNFNLLTDATEEQIQKLENEMNGHGASITRLKPAIDYLKKKTRKKEKLVANMDKRYHEGYEAGCWDTKAYYSEENEIEIPSKKKIVEKELVELQKEGYDIRNAKFLNQDEEWEDLEVPNLKDWQKGFDDGTVCGYDSASSDMSLVNKVTWVLTAVNVAILISLVIKN